MRMSKSSSVILLGIVAGVGGCGGAEQVQHPPVVPAAGTLTYNTAPVADAVVSFFSDESTKAGWNLSGHTDASGKFEISSAFAPGTVAKGVPAGSYTVVVIKEAAPATSTPVDQKANPNAYADMMKKQGDSFAGRGGVGSAVVPASAVPRKYASQATSDLKVTVEGAGKPDLTLSLTD